MSGNDRLNQNRRLDLFVESFIREYVDDPRTNNLGPGREEPAWDDVLLGFSSGADKLYGCLKEYVGPFHWTPAEAFAQGWNVRPGLTAADQERVRAEELTVISFALCFTEATKAANRRENCYPSESWARTRTFGQAGLQALQAALAEALTTAGYPSVAPGVLAQWWEGDSDERGPASTWSERHVAYVSGLGTLGLAGGLITRKGQAVRLGSVVVRAEIPVTPRPYDDPFAYCLFFSRGICGVCASRCPVGSIAKRGRDKRACGNHLRATEEYILHKYGFVGYGCGLCQTKVPCESGIPGRLGDSA